jgi:hypothetical protein
MEKPRFREKLRSLPGAPDSELEMHWNLGLLTAKTSEFAFHAIKPSRSLLLLPLKSTTFQASYQKCCWASKIIPVELILRSMAFCKFVFVLINFHIYQLERPSSETLKAFRHRPESEILFFFFSSSISEFFSVLLYRPNLLSSG